MDLTGFTDAQLQSIGAYVREMDQHSAFSEEREVMAKLRASGQFNPDDKAIAFFVNRHAPELFEAIHAGDL